MLLVLAGLPEPVINEILRCADGSWRMRLDLSYPELRLIVEYDGRQHAENTAQWNRDLRRREELESLGWRIVVVTARDLNGEPGATLDRGARRWTRLRVSDATSRPSGGYFAAGPSAEPNNPRGVSTRCGSKRTLPAA